MRTDVKKICILMSKRQKQSKQPKGGTLEQTEKVLCKNKNYDKVLTYQHFIRPRTKLIISINQECALVFSKKVIQATLEMISNVLLRAPNALKIVFLNREDGDRVGVIQQRISLNGVENASIAQSFLVRNKLCSL